MLGRGGPALAPLLSGSDTGAVRTKAASSAFLSGDSLAGYNSTGGMHKFGPPLSGAYNPQLQAARPSGLLAAGLPDNQTNTVPPVPAYSPGVPRLYAIPAPNAPAPNPNVINAPGENRMPATLAQPAWFRNQYAGTDKRLSDVEPAPGYEIVPKQPGFYSPEAGWYPSTPLARTLTAQGNPGLIVPGANAPRLTNGGAPYTTSVPVAGSTADEERKLTEQLAEYPQDKVKAFLAATHGDLKYLDSPGEAIYASPPLPGGRPIVPEGNNNINDPNAWAIYRRMYGNAYVPFSTTSGGSFVRKTPDPGSGSTGYSIRMGQPADGSVTGLTAAHEVGHVQQSPPGGQVDNRAWYTVTLPGGQRKRLGTSEVTPSLRDIVTRQQWLQMTQRDHGADPSGAMLAKDQQNVVFPSGRAQNMQYMTNRAEEFGVMDGRDNIARLLNTDAGRAWLKQMIGADNPSYNPLTTTGELAKPRFQAGPKDVSEAERNRKFFDEAIRKAQQ